MKTGRNEPCPCGSGKKFKSCHYAEMVRDGFTDSEGLECFRRIGGEIGGLKNKAAQVQRHIVERLQCDPLLVLADVLKDLDTCRVALLDGLIKLAVAEKLQVLSKSDLDFESDLKDGSGHMESVAERIRGRLHSEIQRRDDPCG